MQSNTTFCGNALVKPYSETKPPFQIILVYRKLCTHHNAHWTTNASRANLRTFRTTSAWRSLFNTNRGRCVHIPSTKVEEKWTDPGHHS